VRRGGGGGEREEERGGGGDEGGGGGEEKRAVEFHSRRGFPPGKKFLFSTSGLFMSLNAPS
jgi:hypothetical protein